MTREEFKLKGIFIGLGTLALPIIGVIMTFIPILSFVAPIFFYGGPLILIFVFFAVTYKEKKIFWKTYTCPYCGETFQAEPKDGKVKHLLCNNELYIKDNEVYKNLSILS
ncbi:MAG: hypothetical protein K9L17_13305 [Clostridiales bacterium]|nr:hypothetical protein [Clostridiales bacterium]MCF8023652.1 hypothetical protein [Clostridiales bacterium]